MAARTGGLLLHHELFGFADFELQVIIVTPCDRDLSEDSMTLSGNGDTVITSVQKNTLNTLLLNAFTTNII